MQTLSFQQLQEYLSMKYIPRATSTGLFMKLVEEMGEAAEILNQMEGRKSKDPDSDTSLANELVDIIHYAVAIASINGIDLTQAIYEKDRVASVKYHQNPNLSDYINLHSSEHHD